MSIAKFKFGQLLRRGRGILRWHLKAFEADISDSKRLLLIYDFESQPFSVGDILFLQAASLCVSEHTGLDRIDVALVFESSSPVICDPAFSHIKPEDFLYHLSSVLPAAQFNAKLGSLLMFDSHSRLEKFVSDNVSEYRIWPSIVLYSSKQYLFYHCINDIFPNFCKHGERLPSLQPRPALKRWAQDFIARTQRHDRCVSIQLRRNPKNPLRNSDYASWKRFFGHARENYPVTFFVICSQIEIDLEFREYENVVLVKDYQTSLEQDLALIEGCEFHMGPSSGPGSIAIFNRKPYCMFGFDVDEARTDSLVHDGNRLRYVFSGVDQYWIRSVENFDLICSEFNNLLTFGGKPAGDI